MINLPLFPLKSVLFPGLPIRLHIFEQRYRKMIQVCVDTGKPFGIVLIRKGTEALGPVADTYEIGCIAEIIRLEQLQDGRYNLLAVGRERFKIDSYERSEPFLQGNVSIQEKILEDDPAFAVVERDLTPRVRKYINFLVDTQKVEINKQELPTDGMTLTYLAASLLQIPMREKQLLLELNTASELTARVTQLYRRELALAKTVFAQDKGSGDKFNPN